METTFFALMFAAFAAGFVEPRAEVGAGALIASGLFAVACAIIRRSKA